MCIFAINVDKGQMETNKKEGNMEATAARRSDMASICTKLSCLCHHASVKVARICALTSFALKPTEQSFTKIGTFYGQGSSCCNKCGRDRGREPGKVNPATLYEVERLLNMLRPDYLSPDQSYINIQILCRRFLQDSLKNSQHLQRKQFVSQSSTSISGLATTQADGAGNKITTVASCRPTNVFEALSLQDFQNTQSLLNKMRLQTISPAKTSLPISSPGQRMYQSGTGSGIRLNQQSSFLSMGQTNKAQYVFDAERVKNKQPYGVPLEQQHQYYLIKHEKELEQRRKNAQKKREEKTQHSVNLNSQVQQQISVLQQQRQQFAKHNQHNEHVTQIIQTALKQDSNALQKLTQSASPSVVQAVLNIMKGSMLKSSTSSSPQQQHPVSQQVKPIVSSPQHGTQPLPTVSTLLKPSVPVQQLRKQSQEQPHQEPHHTHQQLTQPREQSPPRRHPKPQLYAQPIMLSSSNNVTPTKYQPPAVTMLNNRNQVNQRAAIPTVSVAEKQKADNFMLAKSHVEDIRRFMQIQMSNLHQKHISEPRQMSGSTVTLTNVSLGSNASPSHASFNLTNRPKTTVELAEQAALAKLQKQEHSKSAVFQQSQQLKDNNRQLFISQSEQMLTKTNQPQFITSNSRNDTNIQSHTAQHLPHQKLSHLQHQQQNNAYSFHNNQSQSMATTSVLPSSDELSGSIIGIDDTIIKELLEDSGILANTFPDIEVDTIGEDKSRKISDCTSLPQSVMPPLSNQIPKSSTSHQYCYSTPQLPQTAYSTQKAQGNSKVNHPQTVTSATNLSSSFVQRSVKGINSYSLLPATSNSINTSQSNLKSSNTPISTFSDSSSHVPSSPQFWADTKFSVSVSARDSSSLLLKNDIKQEAKPTVDQLREMMKKEDIQGEICMDAANNATYRCIICSFAFETLDHLREHVRNVCKPGLQSSSVYNTKIKQDRANSAKAGVETTTVFQCLRCFELCVSDAGIKQHRLTCKRVPTIPSDIKKEAANNKQKCLTKPAVTKSPKKEHLDNSYKVPDLPLPFPYPSLNAETVLKRMSLSSSFISEIRVSNTSVDSKPPVTSNDLTTGPITVPISFSDVSSKSPVLDSLPSSVTSFDTSPQQTVTSSVCVDTVEEMSICSSDITTNIVSAEDLVVSPQNETSLTEETVSNSSLVQKDSSLKDDEKLTPKDNQETTSQPRFTEITGSGGSKFYKCGTCFQTLCSFESFLVHWKECTVKNRNLIRKFELKEMARNMNPITGEVLEHLLEVVAEVATGSGTIPESISLDSSEWSDVEDLYCLRDPCKASSLDRSESCQDSDSWCETDDSDSQDNVSECESEASKKWDEIKTHDGVEFNDRMGIHDNDSGEDIEEGEEDIQTFKNAKRKFFEYNEDESKSASESERNYVSTREAPPKLRDRKTLKSFHNFIHESFKAGVKPTVFKLEEKTTEITDEDKTSSETDAQSDGDGLFCKVCQTSYQTKRILLQHFAGKHLQPYTVKTVADSASYFCHLCQKTFSTFMHYMQHVPNHSVTIYEKMKAFISSRKSAQRSERIASQRGFTKKAGVIHKMDKAFISKKTASKSVVDRLKQQLLAGKTQSVRERLRISKRKRSLPSTFSSSEDDCSSDASNNVVFKSKKSTESENWPDRQKSVTKNKKTRPRRLKLQSHDENDSSINSSLDHSGDDSDRGPRRARVRDDDYVLSEDIDSDGTDTKAPPTTRSRKCFIQSLTFSARRKFGDDSEQNEENNFESENNIGNDPNLSDSDSNSSFLILSQCPNGNYVPYSSKVENYGYSDIASMKDISKGIENTKEWAPTHMLFIRSLSKQHKEKLKTCNLQPTVVLQKQLVDVSNKVGQDVQPTVVLQKQLVDVSNMVGQDVQPTVVLQKQFADVSNTVGQDIQPTVVLQKQLVDVSNKVGQDIQPTVVLQKQLVDVSNKVGQDIQSTLITPDKQANTSVDKKYVVTQQTCESSTKNQVSISAPTKTKNSSFLDSFLSYLNQYPSLEQNMIQGRKRSRSGPPGTKGQQKRRCSLDLPQISESSQSTDILGGHSNNTEIEVSESICEAEIITANSYLHSSEISQMTANSSQVTANSILHSSENSQVTVNSSLIASENSMVTANSSLGSSENSQVTANSSLCSENSKVTANSSSISSENSKVTANSSLGSSENNQVTANSSLFSSENSQVTANSSLCSSENSKVTANSSSHFSNNIQDNIKNILSKFPLRECTVNLGKKLSLVDLNINKDQLSHIKIAALDKSSSSVVAITSNKGRTEVLNTTSVSTKPLHFISEQKQVPVVCLKRSDKIDMIATKPLIATPFLHETSSVSKPLSSESKPTENKGFKDTTRTNGKTRRRRLPTDKGGSYFNIPTDCSTVSSHLSTDFSSQQDVSNLKIASNISTNLEQTSTNVKPQTYITDSSISINKQGESTPAQIKISDLVEEGESADCSPASQSSVCDQVTSKLDDSQSSVIITEPVVKTDCNMGLNCKRYHNKDHIDNVIPHINKDVSEPCDNQLDKKMCFSKNVLESSIETSEHSVTLDSTRIILNVAESARSADLIVTSKDCQDFSAGEEGRTDPTKLADVRNETNSTNLAENIRNETNSTHLMGSIRNETNLMVDIRNETDSTNLMKDIRNETVSANLIKDIRNETNSANLIADCRNVTGSTNFSQDIQISNTNTSVNGSANLSEGIQINNRNTTYSINLSEDIQISTRNDTNSMNFSGNIQISSRNETYSDNLPENIQINHGNAIYSPPMQEDKQISNTNTIYSINLLEDNEISNINTTNSANVLEDIQIINHNNTTDSTTVLGDSKICNINTSNSTTFSEDIQIIDQNATYSQDIMNDIEINIKNVTDSASGDIRNVTDSASGDIRNVTDSASGDIRNVTDSASGDIRNVTDSANLLEDIINATNLTNLSNNIQISNKNVTDSTNLSGKMQISNKNVTDLKLSEEIQISDKNVTDSTKMSEETKISHKNVTDLKLSEEIQISHKHAEADAVVMSCLNIKVADNTKLDDTEIESLHSHHELEEFDIESQLPGQCETMKDELENPSSFQNDLSLSNSEQGLTELKDTRKKFSSVNSKKSAMQTTSHESMKQGLEKNTVADLSCDMVENNGQFVPQTLQKSSTCFLVSENIDRFDVTDFIADFSNANNTIDDGRICTPHRSSTEGNENILTLAIPSRSQEMDTLPVKSNYYHTSEQLSSAFTRTVEQLQTMPESQNSDDKIDQVAVDSDDKQSIKHLITHRDVLDIRKSLAVSPQSSSTSEKSAAIDNIIETCIIYEVNYEPYSQSVDNQIPKCPYEVIGSTGESLPEVIKSTGESLPEVIKSTGESLPEVIKSTGESLPEVITSTRESLPEVIKSTGESMPEVIGSTRESIPEIIGSTRESIPEVIVSTNESNPEVIGSTRESIPEVIVKTNESNPEVIVSTNESNPEVIVSTNESNPEVIVSTNESNPEVIVSTNESNPEVIGSTRESIPELIESTRESLPEVIKSTGESIPEIIMSTRESFPVVNELTRESVPEVIKPTRESMPEVIEPTRESMPEVIKPTRESMPEVIKPTRESMPEVIEPTRESMDCNTLARQSINKKQDNKSRVIFNPNISLAAFIAERLTKEDIEPANAFRMSQIERLSMRQIDEDSPLDVGPRIIEHPVYVEPPMDGCSLDDGCSVLGPAKPIYMKPPSDDSCLNFYCNDLASVKPHVESPNDGSFFNVGCNDLRPVKPVYVEHLSNDSYFNVGCSVLEPSNVKPISEIEQVTENVISVQSSSLVDYSSSESEEDFECNDPSSNSHPAGINLHQFKKGNSGTNKNISGNEATRNRNPQIKQQSVINYNHDVCKPENSNVQESKGDEKGLISTHSKQIVFVLSSSQAVEETISNTAVDPTIEEQGCNSQEKPNTDKNEDTVQEQAKSYVLSDIILGGNQVNVLNQSERKEIHDSNKNPTVDQFINIPDTNTQFTEGTCEGVIQVIDAETFEETATSLKENTTHSSDTCKELLPAVKVNNSSSIALNKESNDTDLIKEEHGSTIIGISNEEKLINSNKLDVGAAGEILISEVEKQNVSVFQDKKPIANQQIYGCEENIDEMNMFNTETNSEMQDLAALVMLEKHSARMAVINDCLVEDTRSVFDVETVQREGLKCGENMSLWDSVEACEKKHNVLTDESVCNILVDTGRNEISGGGVENVACGEGMVKQCELSEQNVMRTVCEVMQTKHIEDCERKVCNDELLTHAGNQDGIIHSAENQIIHSRNQDEKNCREELQTAHELSRISEGVNAFQTVDSEKIAEKKESDVEDFLQYGTGKQDVLLLPKVHVKYQVMKNQDLYTQNIERVSQTLVSFVQCPKGQNKCDPEVILLTHHGPCEEQTQISELDRMSSSQDTSRELQITQLDKNLDKKLALDTVNDYKMNILVQSAEILPAKGSNIASPKSVLSKSDKMLTEKEITTSDFVALPKVDAQISSSEQDSCIVFPGNSNSMDRLFSEDNGSNKDKVDCTKKPLPEQLDMSSKDTNKEQIERDESVIENVQSNGDIIVNSKVKINQNQCDDTSGTVLQNKEEGYVVSDVGKTSIHSISDKCSDIEHSGNEIEIEDRSHISSQSQMIVDVNSCVASEMTLKPEGIAVSDTSSKNMPDVDIFNNVDRSIDNKITDNDDDEVDDFSDFDLVIENDTSYRSMSFPISLEKKSYTVSTNSSNSYTNKSKMSYLPSNANTPISGITYNKIHTSQSYKPLAQQSNLHLRKPMIGTKRKDIHGQFVWDVDDDSAIYKSPLSNASSTIPFTSAVSMKIKSSTGEVYSNPAVEALKRKQKALRDKTETAPFTWDLEDFSDNSTSNSRCRVTVQSSAKIANDILSFCSSGHEKRQNISVSKINKRITSKRRPHTPDIVHSKIPNKFRCTSSVDRHHKSSIAPVGRHHKSSIAPVGRHHKSSIAPADRHHKSSIAPVGRHHKSSIDPADRHHKSSIAPDDRHHKSSIDPADRHHKSSIAPADRHHKSSIALADRHHKSSIAPADRHHKSSIAPVGKKLKKRDDAEVKCNQSLKDSDDSFSSNSITIDEDISFKKDSFSQPLGMILSTDGQSLQAGSYEAKLRRGDRSQKLSHIVSQSVVSHPDEKLDCPSQHEDIDPLRNQPGLRSRHSSVESNISDKSVTSKRLADGMFQTACKRFRRNEDPLTPKLKKIGLIKINKDSNSPPASSGTDSTAPMTRSSEAAIKSFHQKNLRSRGINPVLPGHSQQSSPSKNMPQNIHPKSSPEASSRLKQVCSVQKLSQPSPNVVKSPGTEIKTEISPKSSIRKTHINTATIAVVKRRSPSVPVPSSGIVHTKAPVTLRSRKSVTGRSKSHHTSASTTIFRVDPIPTAGVHKGTFKPTVVPSIKGIRTLHTPLPPGTTAVRPKKDASKQLKWKIKKETKLGRGKKQQRGTLTFKRT